MRIANKERYALKLMIDLACHYSDENIAIETVSRRQGISVASLRAVARALLAAGLIEASPEHPHHYRLSCDPSTISIPEVLETTDGKFACTDCTETNPEQCTRYRVCANVLFWEGMQEVSFPDSKTSLTLQDMADDYQTKNPASDYISPIDIP